MLTLDQFAADIPKFHFWGDTWSVGGFSAKALRELHDLGRSVGRAANGGARIVETGAGASTIAFLLSGADEVFSIAPDAALFDRIRAYCGDQGLPDTALRPMVERSETRLPRLLGELRTRQAQMDLALIDGGHGWPTVFVDFCYVNAMLRQGGLLVLDDIQLHSVKELARLLLHSADYRLQGQVGGAKTRVFVKLTEQPFLGDFATQPYIVDRTRQDAIAGTANELD